MWSTDCTASFISQRVGNMCWFPVDTGGEVAVRFSVNWHVKKGDLSVVLNLHGEID